MSEQDSSCFEVNFNTYFQNGLKEHSNINNNGSNNNNLNTTYNNCSNMKSTVGTTMTHLDTNSASAPTASSSTTTSLQSSSSIGVNLRVTGQCSQGGRKYMEDYFSVAYQQSENTKDLEYAFVGIYDGHGGAEAAVFAKEHLMMEIINQKLFWSDSDQDVLRAIREGYIATHYAMWRDQDKWPKTATGLPSTAGTTATVAFIRREKIYIGHVGDSGIVLGYQNENENFWRAKQLTTDHKPESVAERTRIMRTGGKVVVKSGVPRVVWNRPRIGHKGPVRRNTPVDEIPFLAVARSLGDLWSYNSARNEFIVSPDPDVKVIKINPKTFRCLIFGTDGLWNVVSPQEAVDTVNEKETINERLQAQRGESTVEGAHGQWTNPSKGLVEKALKTWSAKKMRADNTSVVTVILYPPASNVKDSAPSCHTHSYGLEYMQVCADVPMHDDGATSYAEMANKYLPPEEYRNFKYDEDEDDETIDMDYSGVRMGVTNYAAAYTELGYANQFQMATDYYDPLAAQPVREEVVEAESINENDVDDDEDDDDDEELEDEDEEDDATHHEVAHQQLRNNFVNQHLRIENAPKLIEQETLDYMNSFAESYTDALLSGRHMEQAADSISTSSISNNSDSRCSDSTSSSSSSGSSSYQSTVYHQNAHAQHDIIMEQQQYQEQCMSQEDGYSLTKLETRGEQQMRNGSSPSAMSKEVQTFKIFQQNPATEAYDETATPSSPSRENFYDARLPALCNFINTYESKLELNSLLQQEMAEEQQVAMERLEMQRRAEQQSELTLNPQAADLEESICEEYLEEEIMPHDSSASTLPLDETIQINEISSSIASPAAFTAENLDAEDEEAMDIDDATMEELKQNKNDIVIIEKIEILRNKPEHVNYSSPTKPSSSTWSTSPSPSPSPPPASVSTSTKLLNRPRPYTCNNAVKPTTYIKSLLLNPSPAKRAHANTRSHYPNVPNENQERHHSISPCATSSSTLRKCGYGPLLFESNEKRQLRSMAPIVVDYTKRTLRSRNSLSKDMKAKSALNMRRSTSMANQFLRTTASSLLTGNFANQRAQQQQQQQRLVPTTTTLGQQKSLPNPARAVSKSNVIAAQAHSIGPATYAINLRSRQIVQLAPQAATVSAANCMPTAVHPNTRNVTLRTERRNSRNINSRTSPTCKEQRNSSAGATTGISNFSKTTRLQSSVATSLAAPPPSPKLICAVTRARSLLQPKSSISLDFVKRPALRSGGGTMSTPHISTTTTTAAPTATTLQTRSRVQRNLNR